MPECEDCQNARKSYGRLLCIAGAVSLPVENLRSTRGICGPEGILFEPIDIDPMGADE